MDAPYTPYEYLPDRLRKEMQLLQRLKDRVSTQARKVVDVAVTEWQEADARAERTAAALRPVRELTSDSEERAGAVREGEAEKAAYIEAFTSPRKPSKRKQEAPATKTHHKKNGSRSAITGYFGVRRDTQSGRTGFRETVNRKSLGTCDTAEEAAHAYDGAALRDNIALGYDKHKLNFCRARAKALTVQHNTKALLGEDSSGTGSDNSGNERRSRCPRRLAHRE